MHTLINSELIATDIGFIAGACISLILGTFALYKAPRRGLNQVFFLYSFTASIFLLSHVIGINIDDPELSRLAFLFNMITIFTSVFTAHWILELTGRLPSQKKVLTIFYVIAGLITSFYLLFPDHFLKLSEPKLYFPNYYVPGDYYFIGDIFFYSVFLYFTYHTISAYLKADIQLKNRIKYVSVGLIFGYILSSTTALLLYGYKVDPIISALIPFSIIPVAYGIIKEELMDIHVIAKQALAYTLLVGTVGIGIAMIGYLNVYLANIAPDFPSWIIPLLSGIIAAIITRIIWVKLRQNEELKYEFITVIMHNFRTPINHLNWSIEALRKSQTETERVETIKDIENSRDRLQQLTDVLTNKAKSEYKGQQNKLISVNLDSIIKRILNSLEKELQNKNIKIDYTPYPNINIETEEKKIYYALEEVIENAVVYSPKEGVIQIQTTPSRKRVRISIKDHGIGISRENLPNIFKNFYRTHQALLSNIEGLGLGLFMAKNIIEQQGGKIWVKSEGLGKGSTFFIELLRP